jgi:hypothetical protein
MYRLALIPLCLALLALPAPAKRIAAPPSPVQRAIQAEVVVTGKVTAIEKEPVEVEDANGGQKLAHTVAIIKVDSALVGAANMTHLKVGFTASAPGRGRGPIVRLEKDQEGLFFLTKHPSGQFHTFNWMTSPVPAADENYKATLASVKAALAVVADPAKAMKAPKAEDRTFAAIALILKYRTAPQNAGELKLDKIPAEDSRAILKALAEANWTKFDPTLPPPVNAFYMLGINAQDGWVQPKAGQPGVNFNEELQKAFAKWVDGPGKDYRINKFVAARK